MQVGFGPIPVTSIISRQLEHYIVTHYLYPALEDSPIDLSFADQFAFRPTGSTTAAIIAILNTIADMLITNDHVIVVSLDFSRAFDSVKHITLFEKIAKLKIQDNVYNWLRSYFQGRAHCTKFRREVSCVRPISASVVQGSGLGPATYSIAASDLNPKNPEFKMHKFADDSYLITAGKFANKIIDELEHVKVWANRNNLILNCNKTRNYILQKAFCQGHMSPPHGGNTEGEHHEDTWGGVSKQPEHGRTYQ